MKIIGRSEAHATRDYRDEQIARQAAEIERQAKTLAEQHKAIMGMTRQFAELSRTRAAEMVELLGAIGRNLGECVTPDAVTEAEVELAAKRGETLNGLR